MKVSIKIITVYLLDIQSSSPIAKWIALQSFKTAENGLRSIVAMSQAEESQILL